jgi:hypothetical protein
MALVSEGVAAAAVVRRRAAPSRRRSCGRWRWAVAAALPRARPLAAGGHLSEYVYERDSRQGIDAASSAAATAFRRPFSAVAARLAS